MREVPTIAATTIPAIIPGVTKLVDFLPELDEEDVGGPRKPEVAVTGGVSSMDRSSGFQRI